jgi:hypothetical protein
MKRVFSLIAVLAMLGLVLFSCEEGNPTDYTNITGSEVIVPLATVETAAVGLWRCNSANSLTSNYLRLNEDRTAICWRQSNQNASAFTNVTEYCFWKLDPMDNEGLHPMCWRSDASQCAQLSNFYYSPDEDIMVMVGHTTRYLTRVAKEWEVQIP